MNVSTWGEIDSSWIGCHVRVRWEDAGMPLFEGQPSGVPHEYRGTVYLDTTYGFAIEHAFGRTLNFPAHALVQEEEPNAPTNH